MERTVSRSKVHILLAILIAAVVAFSLSAAPAVAYAKDYKAGTMVSDVKTISKKKCKVMGNWKVVKSSNKAQNKIIKNNKKIKASAKANIAFRNNGNVMFKDYKDSKASKLGTWIATTSKVGYITSDGIVLIKAKVVGKRLYITFPKTSKTPKYTWTCTRL